MLGHYPLLNLLIIYEILLQDWFYKQRMYASSCQTMLSDCVEKIMAKGDVRSRRHGIQPIDHHVYEATNNHLGGIVDLHAKSATARSMIIVRFFAPSNCCRTLPEHHPFTPSILQHITYKLGICQTHFPIRTYVGVEEVGCFCRHSILPPMRVPQVGQR